MKRFFAFVLVAATALPALAWFPKGHEILTRAALRALPAGMPQYFRESGDTTAICAWDPDVAKNRATPQLDSTEFPEHFIDSELLGGAPLPALRFDFYKLCASRKLEAKLVGMVPYAVAEWAERLVIAFAEHRRWPADAGVRAKSLVYAGIMAHYAEDLCQPLHTTVDHDGRADKDGKSPRTGIHQAVDGLVENLKMDPATLAGGMEPQDLGALMPAIEAALASSHSSVTRVYELEDAIRAVKNGTVSAAVRDFSNERARASALFTARLYLTAWEQSRAVRFPVWMTR